MLNFLYGSPLGRVLLKLLPRPVCSKLGGWLLGSPPSRCLIGGYIRRNEIDMGRFEDRRYRSFNDFFTRRLSGRAVPERPPSGSLTAPCDGKLSAYPISADRTFSIKRSRYTIGELLDDPALAEQYRDGICLIFRLTPDDYHRYHYIDDGEIAAQKSIPGVLHTVRPIAHSRYPVFVQNARVCTVMHTAQFGPVVQIEVGALMVGKIENYKHSGAFVWGEEKGHFAFGGSTIILLFQKGAAQIQENIIHTTLAGEELAVRVGERIGRGGEGEMNSC